MKLRLCIISVSISFPYLSKAPICHEKHCMSLSLPCSTEALFSLSFYLPSAFASRKLCWCGAAEDAID